MAARRGRPPKSASTLTREAILGAALKLLEPPPGRLSLRGLASALGVTPMALYPHIGDLDALLDALAAQCLAEGLLPGDDESDLRRLLLWYCSRVLRYPGLTSAIVARHGALPAPHQAWTDAVTRCVSERNLPLLWRDVLVDHLHGYALASAATGTDLEAALTVYSRHVDLLLDTLLSHGAKDAR